MQERIRAPLCIIGNPLLNIMNGLERNNWKSGFFFQSVLLSLGKFKAPGVFIFKFAVVKSIL